MSGGKKSKLKHARRSDGKPVGEATVAPGPPIVGEGKAADPGRVRSRAKATPRGSKSSSIDGRAGDLTAAPSLGEAALTHAIEAVLHPWSARDGALPTGIGRTQPHDEVASGGTSGTAEIPARVAPQAPSDPTDNIEAWTGNVGAFIEQAGKAAAVYLQAREPTPKPFGGDLSEAFKALMQVADYWLEPSRLIQAQTRLSSQFLELWAGSLHRFGAGQRGEATRAEPLQPHDRRFTDAEWFENPFFDFVRRSYLLGTDWANEIVARAEDIDEPTREKAGFYLRQLSSALSPTNFVVTNPEVLRDTIRENGGNLVRGMAKLAEDLAAGEGHLRIRQTDSSAFHLGVNVAMTPGKVVWRNALMELLQYAPSTPSVLKRPLLIVPPWINKFYILDLNPEKSFVRWAVSQGLTVFVVSWVNPDGRHRDKDFEAYMREGVFEALDAVEAATGETDVATIGYCVGGTLLAMALAEMAARGETRVSSATFFTTQVDFAHAGDLKVFADEAQIEAIEAEMREPGYLKGSAMAQAFNMLRPEDLIWSPVVDTYLKGKDPLPFDLLAWNADATRMPAANHSFYLRGCYLNNALSRGLMEIGGVRLDLGAMRTPVYMLACREDHIAPARSVFEGAKLFGGPMRYVLAGSGHIAGVVNPPSRAKYGYRSGPPAEGDFVAWVEKASQHPGTWWPDWFAWISAQAPETVPAREPGGSALKTLGDAPGDYVRVKS